MVSDTVANALDSLQRKPVAASLRLDSPERKPLAVDWKQQQGAIFDRVLELARITKQQAADAMGYPDQSAVSRWVSASERVQWDKVAAVPALRQWIPVAWGEVTGAELQVTVIVRRAVAVLLVACALSGCASTKALHVSQAVYIGSQAADLYSTHQVVAQNGRELNPFMATAWQKQIAIKGIESAAVLWLSKRLSKEHRALAAILLSGMSVGYSLIAIRNYQIARGAR